MAGNIYAELADHLGKVSFGIRHCQALYDLLGALFTEEEASVALHLSPYAPEPPERVAERMGEDPVSVAKRLDVMADKGVIYCSQRGQQKWYKIIQVVPGIFELQFMRGEKTPRARRLARLFEAYFHAQQADEPPAVAITPFARVIPVERTVASGIEVFPYEEVSRYIEGAETISVSTCYCRHEKRLLGRGCAYPDDVCLQFGSFARFVIQRGFGREITRQEAHRILERSEEAGLIHTANNTRDRVDFICNCCACCCGVLQSVAASNRPSMAATSNYLARVDEDACSACGECVNRCQMAAIELAEDRARLDERRCIGCGVCVASCPSGALSLIERAMRHEPPGDFKELVMRQMAEKQRGGVSEGG